MGKFPAAIIADVVSNHLAYVKLFFLFSVRLLTVECVLLRKGPGYGAEYESKSQ
jgi:hypothetical protein